VEVKDYIFKFKKCQNSGFVIRIAEFGANYACEDRLSTAVEAIKRSQFVGK